jgi:maleylacetate reductase
MGASHGIGRVLGGAYGVPHGYTSCILILAVLRWNSAVQSERQQEVASLLGGSESEDASEVVRKFVSSLLADKAE